MNQKQKLQLNSEGRQLNQNICEQFPNFFQHYSFNPYSQYWKYPYFPYPDYSLYNKYTPERCIHCRPLSFCSVMTQTSIEHENQQIALNGPKIQNSGTVQISNIYKENKSDEEIDKNNLKLQVASQQQLIKEISKRPEQEYQNQQLSVEVKQEFQKKINDLHNNNPQEILKRMLYLYITFPQAYQNLYQSMLENQNLKTQVFKYFNEKIRTFKKSKQEMIKLIIRKTQRHYKEQYNCKKDDRFKKFGGFKSMNTVYLQKLFSDPKFVKSFHTVSNTFAQQFEAQNNQKLKIFAEKINLAKNINQFKSALKILEEKNKMPWPTHWVEKLKKLFLQIKKTYISQSNQIQAYNF